MPAHASHHHVINRGFNPLNHGLEPPRPWNRPSRNSAPSEESIRAGPLCVGVVGCSSVDTGSPVTDRIPNAFLQPVGEGRDVGVPDHRLLDPERPRDRLRGVTVDLGGQVGDRRRDGAEQLDVEISHILMPGCPGESALSQPVERFSTGVRFFDKGVGGGIPAGGLLALVAPASSQSELLFEELVRAQSVWYVSTVCSDEVGTRPAIPKSRGDQVLTEPLQLELVDMDRVDTNRSIA